jgi:multiple sugar transport system substrate-binding protein
MRCPRRFVAKFASCALLVATASAWGVTPAVAAVKNASFGVNAKGTVTFWYRSGFVKYYDQIIKEFNATHKGLTVKPVPVSDSDFITKLATAIRAGSPPDLVAADDVDSMIFISKDEYLNLTKYVNALPFKKDLSPGALHLASFKGQYYGTPSIADDSVIWYNKSLFSKAGLNPSTPPTSLLQVVADAKKITDLGPKDYGFSFAGDCPGCLTFTIVPSVYAGGSDLMKGQPEHQTATIEGNRVLSQVLTDYQKLWKQHLVPTANQTQNGSTWGKDFLSGDIGMLPCGYGCVGPHLTTSMQSQVGIFPIPGPTGGWSTYDGGANYGIPSASRNASGAWEFIKYAISAPSQEQTPIGGVEPINSQALTPAFKKTYPLVAKIVGYEKNGNAPYTVAHDALFNLVSQPWQEMFNEAVYSGNVAAALKSGQSGFTSVLTELQG